VVSARFPCELLEELPQALRRQIRSQVGQDGVVIRQLSEVSVTRLKTQFEMLELAIDTGQREERARRDLLLSAWAEHCQATSIEDGALHPIVERAVRTLRETPTLNSMETLARMCGASSSWLSRLFRQQMGVSLVDFRNRHRIERFFELYRSKPQQNIMDLASVAGFGSYAQFHRVFRKTLGFRPAELQRLRGATQSLLHSPPRRLTPTTEAQVL
jgi:AraC-like DNA-binding protein